MIIKYERTIHYLMCVMGGFFGGYALLLRHGFGSAATGNLLECMISLSLGNFEEVMIRFGGGLMFLLPFMVSKWMELKTDCNRKDFSIALSCAGLIILGFLPGTVHPVLALYPLFFITGFQWSVFSGVKEYPCSTIFISNNTRQCFSALAEYLVTKDIKMRSKSAFYGFSICCFLAGGLIAAFLTGRFGPEASFGGIAILLLVKCIMRSARV